MRAENDLDAIQILSLTVSVFIEAKKVDIPCKLCVVFDQIHPLITNKENTFSTLVAASKPPKAFLDSKFTVDAVAEFQVGYQKAQNKETFLKKYATYSLRKPSIDDQIEAVVVRVLLEKNPWV